MKRFRSGFRWLPWMLLSLSAAGPLQGPEPSAATQASSWVHARGWRIGRFADGQFVAIGTAPIDARGAEPGSTRQLAFDLACLDAKNQLATYLGAEVSSESSLLSVQSGDPVADAASHLPAGASAETLGVERFRQACWVVARAETCGLIAERAFFSPDEAAVVLRCSGSSLALVAATAEQRAVSAPGDAPDLRAIRALPDEELVDAFGVRVARDTRGHACLVAFGQSQARDEPLSIPRAAQRAREAAIGSLRRHLHERVLGRSGVQNLSLEIVERERVWMESSRRFLHRLEGESRPVAMPTPVLREWITTRDGRSMVGCAVLLGSGHGGEDAALPSIGSGAVVEIGNDRLKATAIGFGCDSSLGSLHPAIRRCRAVRAAVVTAKLEIARAFSQVVATSTLSRTSDGDGMRAESEVRTQVLRQALAGARIEWAKILRDGDTAEACVRITIDASPVPPAGGGLLVFDSPAQGAEALAGLALEGLCPPGTVRAFVRNASELRPMTFAIGLGGGDRGMDQARIQADDQLALLGRSEVEGESTARSSMSFPDALTAEGCATAFRETLLSRWSQSAEVHAFPDAQHAYDRRDDLWSCVKFSTR